jgi:anionic cell wall polymer biosynthesis LytR-Cps2A-Psr (LCP) family protein
LTVIAIALVAVALTVIVVALRAVGKSNIYATVAGTEATGLGKYTGENTDEELADNQIFYNDQVYTLNEDLITILVMGIDNDSAQSLFLVLINPHNENVYIVGIDCNSMVDVDVFDGEGNYEGRYIKQAARQYGYGDGQEESCKRQAEAVSRMFYNIPINDYIAINMDAIPELDDLVGGVSVDAADMNQQQSQIQYFINFAAKAKSEASADVRVAARLYRTAKKNMVTDMKLSSYIYLATEVLGYEFDMEHLYFPEGETVRGNNFEEFYVDEDALQQLIVDLFYEPAE